METGLAYQMVYGEGSNQNTKHKYAGTIKNVGRPKTKVKPNKKRKKLV